MDGLGVFGEGGPMVQYSPNAHGVFGLLGVRHPGLYRVYNGPKKTS